ncbi:hypothetical protein TRFO_10082 [Tritrichomonas foetus]|uniref:Nucleotide-diphospho-sugar transferase domain-containing protein n=1 Tax=Tritrichomonas foetus TaxID=1144522 RepID=A0A1J4JAG6_9EUKA|nr:hypothetical protein TRFO_10082 [Tritrichomonas foetus]|eukprot:OHS96170.1 hypothetical protein TRFO_10082 [Tritrichomonas foetus]
MIREILSANGKSECLLSNVCILYIFCFILILLRRHNFPSAFLLIYRFHDVPRIYEDEVNYNLPLLFTQQLKNYSLNSPINNKSKHHTLFLFLTSSGYHLHYTANAYCSLKVYLQPNYYIFIALDKKSFIEMNNLNIPTILYSDTLPKVDITVLRLIIANQLLMWDVDVIQSDSDLVYFDNPLQLFEDEDDWEVSYENPQKISKFRKSPGYTINCGFWKLKSSTINKIFMKRWILSCFKYKMPDQESLTAYLKTQNGSWIDKNRFRFYFSDDKIYYTIQFIDTLKVTLANSIFCEKHRLLFKRSAKARNISMPVVYHLAWFWKTRKPSALADKNAWFINFPHNKKCKNPPPNGTKMFWDKKFDIQHEIPLKFNMSHFPP